MMYYLKYAKDWAIHAGAERIDGGLPPDECMKRSQTCALVSIAGSLESIAAANFEGTKEIFSEVEEQLSTQGLPGVTVKLSVLKDMAKQVAHIELLSVWSDCNWENYKSRTSNLKTIHRLAQQIADLLVEFTNELDPLGSCRSSQCE